MTSTRDTSGGKIDPSDGIPDPAVGESGNGPATNTHAATGASYPSPAPSAAPLHLQSQLAIDTPVDTPVETAREATHSVKSVRDYWKQVYSASWKDTSNQLDRKRKDSDAAQDNHRAKRHRTTDGLPVQVLQTKQTVPPTGDAGEDGPLAETASLGNVATQKYLFSILDGGEQIKHLENDIDTGDPKAARDLRQLNEAVLSFGWNRCKGKDGKWELAGFGSHLYHHQAIGVWWMLGREMHPEGPKGGILADEMGLGKTVQLLACMSQNLPSKSMKTKESKTLIVAPKRLLRQWYKEIKAHCSSRGMKGVVIYSAAKAMMDEEWEEQDIILTNYEQVQRQLPSSNDLQEIEELRLSGNLAWKTRLRECAGPLFRDNWYRVVLDEAHVINNRGSQTSKACRYLVCRYRWVLTGTPLTNNTDEFFPYLDFLRTKYVSFDHYHDDMGDVEDEEQKEKLRSAYQELSLGRRGEDEFMGKFIIQIPKPRPTEQIMVEFSPHERKRYQEVENARNKIREAKNSRSGSKTSTVHGDTSRLNNWLRFFTSHPALVEPRFSLNRPDEPQEEPRLPELTTSVHYYCRFCRKVLVEPQIGECGHAFCKQCSVRKNARCRSCDVAVAPSKPAGDDCFSPLTLAQVGSLAGGFAKSPGRGKGTNSCLRRSPGDDECGLQPSLGTRPAPRKNTRKTNPRKNKTNKSQGAKKTARKAKKAKKKSDPTERIGANTKVFLGECDKEPWNPIPHSAKTRAAMDLVRKWRDEAPDDKMILFVHWVPMLPILGRMLFQDGFRFVYLWGEMEADQQETSIKAFQTVPEIKIMLISVSCGAHGLNLTVANRAIVLDHWWHKNLEQQGFGRIHRIGQVKVIHTAKIAVAGSTDEEILKLQDKKELAIAAAVRGKDPADGDDFDLLGCYSQLDKEMLAGIADISGDDRSSGSDDDSDGESNDDKDEDNNDGHDTDAETDSRDGDESEYQPALP